MTSPFVTAVIGAGAAGTLVVAHLARAHSETSPRQSVVHIDPSPHTGRGVAYSTFDDWHFLNVPTAKMTAFPDEPNHFLEWVRANPQPGGDSVEPGDFVRRSTFGTYLHDVVNSAVKLAPQGFAYRRLHEDVFSVTWGTCTEGRPLATITLADGSTLTANAVVLATGTRQVRRSGLPDALCSSRSYIPDPWAGGGVQRVAHTPITGDVLVVGSGLTAVDVAFTVSSPQRTVHVVSRNGWWPEPHLATPAHPIPPSADIQECVESTSPVSYDALREAITTHLRAASEELGDWRPAIDGLRPVTQKLWGQLSDEDRAAFLRDDATTWNVHRHRMSPRTRDHLTALEESGQVTCSSLSLVDATETAEGLSVCVSDGRCLTVQWVIDCRGPEIRTQPGMDPLLDSLIDAGVTSPGPAGLGVRTLNGQLHNGSTASPPPMWTLGALRVGELWETTAMPEIRVQAQQVAACVHEYSQSLVTAEVPEDSAAVVPQPVGVSA